MSELFGYECRRRKSAVQSLVGVVGSVVLAGFVPAAPSRTEAPSREVSVPDRQVDAAVKPRVFILTDIGVDPDDSESLVRFLLYTNEWDVEGIAAVTSTWLRD